MTPPGPVGVTTAVVVDTTLPEVNVIVEGPAGEAPLGPEPLAGVEAPDVGTKTMTPVKGKPVGIPAEFVGVMGPVVVRAMLPRVYVVVGRLAGGAPLGLAPLGTAEAPAVGTTTRTPVTAVTGTPKPLEIVMRVVKVWLTLPNVEVIVGIGSDDEAPPIEIAALGVGLEVPNVGMPEAAPEVGTT